MNGRKPQQQAAEGGQPFLERWSRKKAQARAGVEPEDDAPAEPAAVAPRAETAPPAPAELPDIESLDEDSDYSAFMAEGVDESLRLAALRKLFRSAKFNVCDGLDDYCGDYTQFEPLGGLVTADMRHQMERAAKAAEKLLAEGRDGDDAPAGGAGPEAARQVAVEPAADQIESAPDESPEPHDQADRPA